MGSAFVDTARELVTTGGCAAEVLQAVQPEYQCQPLALVTTGGCAAEVLQVPQLVLSRTFQAGMKSCPPRGTTFQPQLKSTSVRPESLSPSNQGSCAARVTTGGCAAEVLQESCINATFPCPA
jgi:hypothetical protein